MSKAEAQGQFDSRPVVLFLPRVLRLRRAERAKSGAEPVEDKQLELGPPHVLDGFGRRCSELLLLLLLLLMLALALSLGLLLLVLGLLRSSALVARLRRLEPDARSVRRGAAPPLLVLGLLLLGLMLGLLGLLRQVAAGHLWQRFFAVVVVVVVIVIVLVVVVVAAVVVRGAVRGAAAGA